MPGNKPWESAIGQYFGWRGERDGGASCTGHRHALGMVTREIGRYDAIGKGSRRQGGGVRDVPPLHASNAPFHLRGGLPEERCTVRFNVLGEEGVAAADNPLVILT